MYYLRSSKSTSGQSYLQYFIEVTRVTGFRVQRERGCVPGNTVLDIREGGRARGFIFVMAPI